MRKNSYRLPLSGKGNDKYEEFDMQVFPPESTISPDLDSPGFSADESKNLISKNLPTPSEFTFEERTQPFPYSDQTTSPRRIKLNEPLKRRKKYAPNLIDNRQYNSFTFLPKVLYNQFKYFLNLYFLLVALSQFVPQLKIGYIFAYFGPLIFVLTVTILQEWYDDHLRKLRDAETNNQKYKVLRTGFDDYVQLRSRDIIVGDMVIIKKNQRVPADMLILKTSPEVQSQSQSQTQSQTQSQIQGQEQGQSENTSGSSDHYSGSTGTCFIRTDQLDGETDWKLRAAITITQNIDNDLDFLKLDCDVSFEQPHKDIYSFSGNLADYNMQIVSHSSNSSKNNTDRAHLETPIADHYNLNRNSVAVDINNTLWKDSTLASGQAVGLVVYTGKDTRSEMNTSSARVKVGILDQEVNFLTKILFVVTMAISLTLVMLDGFRGAWIITICRFVILFSCIIPISLRVNLEMGKLYYCRLIQKDDQIEGTIVRTSNIPEELGRLEYLITDKTGTLTCNEMQMMRIHLGNISYSRETMDEVAKLLRSYNNNKLSHSQSPSFTSGSGSFNAGYNVKFIASYEAEQSQNRAFQTFKVVEALALCHNVTPTFSADSLGHGDQDTSNTDLEYSASSPDEIAIVEWAKSVGLTLVERSPDGTKIRLNLFGTLLDYTVLTILPFTSDSKRMGIIVRNEVTSEIEFIMKGADSVMTPLITFNDWVDEEVSNMAREGLRTLIVGKKPLTEQYLLNYLRDMEAAKAKIQDRKKNMDAVVADYLEFDLQVVAVTGVEDKLQDGVQSTLEQLRNAGFKVWMLTGDKIETAVCIAISSKLVDKNASFHIINDLGDEAAAKQELDLLQSINAANTCLVIDGKSLQVCLDSFPKMFIEIASKLSAVVCCRCSPTQKGEIVALVQTVSKKRVLAIGDGGNDVSMIQQANIGIGLAGLEGQQASLASDIAITKFSHLSRLLLWHGRNSYKRSCKLAQFVMHRGLIISIMQFAFSVLFYYAPISLFDAMLVVGYSTVYTMLPVFLLVMDSDISEQNAMLYPELYRDLIKGRNLNLKTFLVWLLMSIYQGTILVYLALQLFERDYIHITSILFSALILNELVMVLLQLHFLTWLMVYAQLASLAIYFGSMLVLPSFDIGFVMTWSFFSKVLIITAVSSVPVHIITVVVQIYAPSSHSKLD